MVEAIGQDLARDLVEGCRSEFESIAMLSFYHHFERLRRIADKSARTELLPAKDGGSLEVADQLVPHDLANPITQLGLIDRRVDEAIARLEQLRPAILSQVIADVGVPPSVGQTACRGPNQSIY